MTIKLILACICTLLCRTAKPVWAGGGAERGSQQVPEWYGQESSTDLEGGALREVIFRSLFCGRAWLCFQMKGSGPKPAIPGHVERETIICGLAARHA